MTDKQRIEKACEDEAFQAALQRYAHANGSSMAIMQAAARALANCGEEAACADEVPLIEQVRGRIRFLRDRGEVKTPDLLRRMTEEICRLETQGRHAPNGKDWGDPNCTQCGKEIR